MQSVFFAKKLAKAWWRESSRANFSEVQQFKALMRSFASLRGPFKIEEFHGMKHQVVFNGQGSWGRPSARCEISDLLIVSYRKHPEFQARATLLQAKKSNEKHTSLCRGFPSSIPYTDFKANLEQWDLLSRRPDVLPYPPFHCHPEILSGAILPSIGSIGVFHRYSGKNYGFFYMSADSAEPLSAPKRKHAKLKTKTVKTSRNVNGYTECTFACCLPTFAKSLYELEIGTPIDQRNVVSDRDGRYRNIFRGWLRSILYSHLEMTDNESLLARDLLGQIASEYEGQFMSEPPSLLLLNSDEIEFNKQRQSDA